MDRGCGGAEPSTANGLSVTEFFDRLLANLGHKQRDVYASAAEVTGMVRGSLQRMGPEQSNVA